MPATTPATAAAIILVNCLLFISSSLIVCSSAQARHSQEAAKQHPYRSSVFYERPITLPRDYPLPEVEPGFLPLALTGITFSLFEKFPVGEEKLFRVGEFSAQTANQSLLKPLDVFGFGQVLSQL